jgi:hypothetical protein
MLSNPWTADNWTPTPSVAWTPKPDRRLEIVALTMLLTARIAATIWIALDQEPLAWMRAAIFLFVSGG